MDLQISEGQIINCQYPGTTATIRLWYTEYAIDSAGQPIIEGNGSQGIFKIVACTIDPTTKILTYPAFIVKTTSDARPVTSQLVARFYDQSNRPRDYLFQTPLEWVIPASLAPSCTLAELQIRQLSTAPVNPPIVQPTFDQVEELIAAAVSGDAAPPALTTRQGIGKLSKVAVDVTNPIFAGANENIITGNSGVRAFAEFSSLANAISQIGSTQTTLLIPTAITTNSVTVPSTLTLDFSVAGSVSVNSGQTLTINGFMVDPGNRQVFAGTGHKVFGAGSVSAINLAWYNNGTPKATGDINDILTSIANLGGGDMLIPQGTYTTDGGHEAVSGLTVRGAGINPNGVVSRIKLSGDTRAGFHIGPSLLNIQFNNVSLVGSSTTPTAQYGVVVEGSSGESTIGLTFTNVLFKDLNQGVRVHELTSGFECKDVVYNQCQWINTTDSSIFCDAFNCDMSLFGGYALIGANSDFGHFVNIGYLQAIGLTLEGPSEAGCTGSTPSILRARNVWYFGVDHAQVDILNCRDEGFQYWATIDAQTVAHTIRFTSNLVQSLIQCNASCWIDSVGNNYFRNAFLSDGIASARVRSAFDTVRDTDYCGNTGTVTPNGFTSPSTFSQLQTDAELTLNQYLAITLSSIFNGTVTRPVAKYISEEIGKYLLQVGTAVNHYSWLRDTTGFLQAVGSQTIANRGYGFDGPILQTAEQATLPTSSASQAIIGLNTSHILQWNENGGATKSFIGTTTTMTVNRLQKATADRIIGNSAISEVAGAVSWSGSLVVTGTGSFSGDFAIATNKFTVTAASGNTAIAGTLNVTGASTLAVTTATTIAIGSGTVITKILKGTVTIDPASITATTVSSQTFTLTGAVVGDSLTLNPPAAGLTAGLVVCQCFVSAANTITVVLYNTSLGPIDEPSASWTYKLVRS